MLTGYTSPSPRGMMTSTRSTAMMPLDRTNQFYELIREMDGSNSTGGGRSLPAELVHHMSTGFPGQIYRERGCRVRS